MVATGSHLLLLHHFFHPAVCRPQAIHIHIRPFQRPPRPGPRKPGRHQPHLHLRVLAVPIYRTKGIPASRFPRPIQSVQTISLRWINWIIRVRCSLPVPHCVSRTSALCIQCRKTRHVRILFKDSHLDWYSLSGGIRTLTCLGIDLWLQADWILRTIHQNCDNLDSMVGRSICISWVWLRYYQVCCAVLIWVDPQEEETSASPTNQIGHRQDFYLR